MLFVEIDAVRRSAEDLGRPLRGPLDVEVHLDAVERMRLWKAAGGRIVGFAHVPEVARGELGEDVAVRLLWTVHERAGNPFDTLMQCPHDPDAPTPDLARCWCRPPKPGLLTLAQLVALTQSEQLLARDVVVVDLRLPDRVTVRLPEGRSLDDVTSDLADAKDRSRT